MEIPMLYHFRRFWSNPYRQYTTFILISALNVALLASNSLPLWADLLISLIIGLSLGGIFRAGRNSIIHDEIERDTDRS